MDFQDLDQARALHGALLELFVAHAGGETNPAALARIEQLCDAAANAVDDTECRVAIRGVKSYSALFFSDDPGMEAGSLSSADYLRLRIYNALSAFRGRLGTLEAERLLRQKTEFELRRREQPEPPPLSSASVPVYENSQPRNIKVLVVEDNRDSAESLRRLLYYSGYEVAVAYTGQEGLRAAKRMRPDVILCDIGLPDTNGFTVAAALREETATAGARLIAVTAYGEDEDRRRAMQAGFDLHLVKPVDPEVLLKKIEAR
ncbi:MAG: response regulator [Betaproteobacteria bacterium]|nr:MAG: response regulator [Betaproteobacteria bacterium]